MLTERKHLELELELLNQWEFEYGAQSHFC